MKRKYATALLIATIVTLGTLYGIKLNTKPSYSIAIITDIDHCQTRNAVSKEHLLKIGESMKTNNAKTLISLGDNISHRLGTCSETAKKDLQHVVEALRTFGDDTHFVLGDHDIESSIDSVTLWQELTHKSLNNAKNFYSFDRDDIHIIILDTILGGDQMSPSCKVDETCLALKESDIEAYEKYKDRVSLTRKSDMRDKGRIGEQQLKWLENDLMTTEKEKILILSDHPLFPLTTHRKSYEIIKQKEVENILQKFSKTKKIVAVSGEAHIWHHEKRGDIDYYILDEHKKQDAWAMLTWGNEPVVTPYQNDIKMTPLGKN